MEQYFIELSKRLEGYEDFEKESYAFKVNVYSVRYALLLPTADCSFSGP